jgi:hypothetical protein
MDYKRSVHIVFYAMGNPLLDRFLSGIGFTAPCACKALWQVCFASQIGRSPPEVVDLTGGDRQNKIEKGRW